MKTIYVLYNPLSGTTNKDEIESHFNSIYQEEKLEFIDATSITNHKEFLESTNGADLVICGGDGTLNKLINYTRGINYTNTILYYPSGTGNDFLREITTEEVIKPIDITSYLKNLPTVIVNDKEYNFLNGVGFGIDGYCCEKGDELKAKGKKKINYTSIAIMGLLFHYKPTDAIVIVDGKEYKFKKVWIAPTMHGKYYGGGMIPTPEQKRGSGELSTMIFHGSGKLKTLMIFPSIFKGEHVKNTNHVTVFKGKEITVKFDEARSIQIDGETILNIKEYTAKI